MADTKKLFTQLNGIPVCLVEEIDRTSGFKRDVVLELDITKHQQNLQKIGVVRYSNQPIHLLDEVIWRLGSHVLHIYEDYPEVFKQESYGLELINQLQDDLIELKKSFNDESLNHLQNDASTQTILKYHLIDLIRNYIANNDDNQVDAIYLSKGVDHALKAALNYIDDYEFIEHDRYDQPKELSLQLLHKEGHLQRLNNQSANTITNLVKQTTSNPKNTLSPKKSWLNEKPSWLPMSYKAIINLTITVLLTLVFSILLSHLEAIKMFASAFSISNPFMAAGLFSILIILFTSYITQLTPSNALTLDDFILKSFKSLLTMLTCILVLVHFFYPYNFLNLAMYHVFGGSASLAITSSISIILTIFIFIILNQIFTFFTEPDRDNNFPTHAKGFDASYFLIFRAPYRNYVWQFFQTKENRHFFWLCLTIITGLVIFSILQQQFVVSLITSISTIFSISSVMAILAIISLGLFATKLGNLVNVFKKDESKQTPKIENSNLIDKIGMITGFFAVMGYVIYIDFSIISNVFSIIGNLLSLKMTTVMFSSQLLLVIFLCSVPFLLPKNMNIKELFYKNPFLQAEHIFMELNEFYYLYGLRHPIIMMLFLGLFIVAFASFYNHFIPVVISNFAHTLATALINMNVGTELLAFTASLMIGNMLIIFYDSFTAGKRSFIAKLSRIWEMYPLDTLAGIALTLAVLNLFILIPYIKLHLGSVAMIGSLAFLFKVVVIAYDFQRDNAQKSFIASFLMMLLWPFLAIKQLMDNPSIDEFYRMARSLEKAIIFFLLTLLYDIPFKIFLRIFEVMIYSLFNVFIAFTANYGIDRAASFLICSKKNILSYIDFFKCSAKTTLFTNRTHYKLWHLIIVIGLIWMSVHLITVGIGLMSTPLIYSTTHLFNPNNILNGLMYNPLVHSIFFIQLGWSIILILSLALIRLTNLTHNDISFEAFKQTIIGRITELSICIITCSAGCILLCAINLPIIATLQVSILFVSLVVQSIITHKDYANGASKMMRHCFDANNKSLTSGAIFNQLTSPQKEIRTKIPDDGLVSTTTHRM